MTGSDLTVRYPLPHAADLQQLGALVASSAYFSDAREAAQAAVKIMAGAELGIGPIASMRGIDIIKGEVSLSAGMVAAMVRRSGVYDYRVERWDNEACEIVFTRNRRPLTPSSVFTLEDAKRAGLAGPNYQKFPRNMLFARAMTNGARVHCPEVFVGAVYTPDELVDGEVVLEPSEPPEAQVDPSPQGGQERAPETVEDTPATPMPTTLPDAAEEAVPVVHMYAITEAQSTEVKRLLGEAMQRGMTSNILRAELDHMGLRDTALVAGWVDTLSKEKASELIAFLQAGVEPPVHDPAGE
jgi:hypothetical protein